MSKAQLMLAELMGSCQVIQRQFSPAKRPPVPVSTVTSTLHQNMGHPDVKGRASNRGIPHTWCSSPIYNNWLFLYSYQWSSRLDPSKIHWKTHSVITQPNFILSELFSSLNQVRLWVISRIWPNNPFSPNDEHRVKSNSHIASRKSVEFIPDYDLTVAALKSWDNNKPKIKFGIVDVNSDTIIFNLLVFFKNRFKS